MRTAINGNRIVRLIMHVKSYSLRKWCREALVAGFMLTSVIVQPASGQELVEDRKIFNPEPDINGVDVLTGNIYIPVIKVDTPAAGHLGFTLGVSREGDFLSGYFLGTISAALTDPSLWQWNSGEGTVNFQNFPRVYTVTLQGTSKQFKCFSTSGDCEEYWPRTGATLEFVNNDYQQGYIYTLRDGTRARYPAFPTDAAGYGNSTAPSAIPVVIDVVYPNGEKISGSLTSRVSNLGYSLTSNYPTSPRQWYLNKGNTGLNTWTFSSEDTVVPYSSGIITENTSVFTDDLARKTKVRVTLPGYTGQGIVCTRTVSYFITPDGVRTDLTYGFSGTLAGVTALTRNGRTWTYGPNITDPLGGVYVFTRSQHSSYSEDDFHITYVGGNPCTIPSSTVWRVASITTPSGRTTSYGYDGTSNTYTSMAEVAGYLGKPTISNQTEQLASTTFPEGDKYAYEYDARGNLTKTTQVPKSGGAGKVVFQASFPSTCANRVTCNQPTWTRDAAGGQRDYTYDPTHGSVLTKLDLVDANGLRRKTWNEYTSYDTGDGLIWRLAATHVCSVYSNGSNNDCGTVNEQVTSYTYWEKTFLPVTVTQTNGTGSMSATTTYSYDAWGHVLSVTDPTSVTKYFRYDIAGRKTWEIAPNGNGAWVATRTTYDVMDRVTRVDVGTLSDPGSSALQITNSTLNGYDLDGNRVKTTVTDGAGQKISVEQFAYDAVSRLVCSVQRMNPSSFDSTADACAVGPQGSNGPDRVTRYSYDLDGQLTKTVKGVGAMNGGQGIVDVEMGYTNNNQVAWRKDGNANPTSYTYDDYDRLDRTTFADNSFEKSEYDTANRLWKFTKRDGNYLTHSYDGASRLASTTFSNGDPTITRTYDGLGRPVTISRNGQALTYGRDSLGRLSSEAQPAGTVTYGYDLAGRRTQLSWPGSYSVNYDYNSAGTLWRMRENGVTSGLGLLATWSFDSLGRPITLSRGNDVTTSLTRDTAGRLATLAHDPAGSTQDVQLTFMYSPASQLTRRASTNAAWAWAPPSTTSTSYVPDVLNRYASVNGVAFAYDGRGNLTNDGVRTYGYDFLNHLTSVSGGGSNATLGYDPQERMYSLVSNGSTTRFLYDGVHVIAAYDGSGNLLRRYVHGAGADQPLVWLEGSATAAGSSSTPDAARWLLSDERGSVIGHANASGSVSINTYGSYGEPGASNQGRFGYTGQMWLPEVGLYHYKARAYNPTLGRFMQTDPIGYGDGMNLYTYVGNDPLNKADPMGLYSCGDSLSKGQCSAFTDAQNAAKAQISTAINNLSTLKKDLASGKLTDTDKSVAAVIDKYMGKGAGGDAKSVDRLIDSGSKMLGQLNGNMPVQNIAQRSTYTFDAQKTQLGVMPAFYNSQNQARQVAHESAHHALDIRDTPLYARGMYIYEYGEPSAVLRANLWPEKTWSNPDSLTFGLGFPAP